MDTDTERSVAAGNGVATPGAAAREAASGVATPLPAATLRSVSVSIWGVLPGSAFLGRRR